MYERFVPAQPQPQILQVILVCLLHTTHLFMNPSVPSYTSASPGMKHLSRAIFTGSIRKQNLETFIALIFSAALLKQFPAWR